MQHCRFLLPVNSITSTTNCTLSQGGLYLHIYEAWRQPLTLLAALYSYMQNLKKYPFNVRTAVAIIRHPEKFVPRYGEVATHITWKALWVWRCPARCYNSFVGSWSWSFQLIPHHTICLYQWRLWGLLLCSCNSTASHLSDTLLIHALRVRSMHMLYFCFSPQTEQSSTDWLHKALTYHTLPC